MKNKQKIKVKAMFIFTHLKDNMKKELTMGKRDCCRSVQLCSNALRRSTGGACGNPAKAICDGPTSCLISGSVSRKIKR